MYPCAAFLKENFNYRIFFFFYNLGQKVEELCTGFTMVAFVLLQSTPKLPKDT